MSGNGVSKKGDEKEIKKHGNEKMDEMSQQ